MAGPLTKALRGGHFRLTPTAAATPRLGPLDAVRTLSVVVVMGSHLVASREFASGGAIGSFTTRLRNNGSYGVTMFLVVSGFIITRTLLQRNPDLPSLDVRDFYVRRLSRLGPLAVATLVLATLMLLVTSPSPARDFVIHRPDSPFRWWMAASYPMLGFNWARIANAGTAFGWGLTWDIFWSLALEEQFYLVYPWLIRRAGSTRRLAGCLAVAVVAGVAWRALVTQIAPLNFLLGFTATPAGLDALALGALTCLLTRRIEPLPRAWASTLIFGGAGLTLTVLCSTDIVAHPWHRVGGPLVLALAVAAVILGSVAGERTPKIPIVLARPGELSYGMYLLHPFALFLLWPSFRYLPGPIALAALSVATFLAAMVSYRWLEGPANRAIRAHLGRRLASQPARP